LRAVFGDPTFSVGSRFLDGSPPEGTLAFEASGHIVLLEQGPHIPDVEEGSIPEFGRWIDAYHWGGLDTTVRHEYGHRAMEILFDPARPSRPDMAQGRTGAELNEEWLAVSGPYRTTVVEDGVVFPARGVR
jgi:hypothetical protein